MEEAPIFAKPIASLYITTHTYFCHLPKFNHTVSWKWRAINQYYYYYHPKQETPLNLQSQDN